MSIQNRQYLNQIRGLDEAKSVPLVRKGQGTSMVDTHPKRKDGKIERMYQAKDDKEYSRLIASADTGRMGNAHSVQGSPRRKTVTVVFDNDRDRMAYEKKLNITEEAGGDYDYPRPKPPPLPGSKPPTDKVGPHDIEKPVEYPTEPADNLRGIGNWFRKKVEAAAIDKYGPALVYMFGDNRLPPEPPEGNIKEEWNEWWQRWLAWLEANKGDIVSGILPPEPPDWWPGWLPYPDSLSG